MTIDEYCEDCGKSAKQKFEEQSERDKELMRNASNFGRRSVIMEIMNDIYGTFDEYDRILGKISGLSPRDSGDK